MPTKGGAIVEDGGAGRANEVQDIGLDGATGRNRTAIFSVKFLIALVGATFHYSGVTISRNIPGLEVIANHSGTGVTRNSEAIGSSENISNPSGLKSGKGGLTKLGVEVAHPPEGWPEC